MPESNHLFRESVWLHEGSFSLHVTGQQAHPLLRGMPEMRLLELIDRARSPYAVESLSGVIMIAQRIALVLAAPVFLLFGLALRRGFFRRPNWWVAKLASGFAATAVLAVAAWQGPRIRGYLFDGWMPTFPTTGALSFWFALALAATLTLVLARRARVSADQMA